MIGRGTPRTIRRIDRMTDLVSGLEPERMPSPTLGDHDSRARDRQSHIRHKLLNVEYRSLFRAAAATKSRARRFKRPDAP